VTGNLMGLLRRISEGCGSPLQTEIDGKTGKEAKDFIARGVPKGWDAVQFLIQRRGEFGDEISKRAASRSTISTNIRLEKGQTHPAVKLAQQDQDLGLFGSKVFSSPKDRQPLMADPVAHQVLGYGTVFINQLLDSDVPVLHHYFNRNRLLNVVWSHRLFQNHFALRSFQ